MDICYSNFFLKNGTVYAQNEFDGRFLQKGKSLYEVIRVVNGVPLFLEQHLHRLANSSKLSGLPLPVSFDTIRDTLLKLISSNIMSTGTSKIVFNYLPGSDNRANCSFYAYFLEPHYPSEQDYRQGVDTFIYHAERENPNAKIVNYDFRELMDQLIKENQVTEVILVNNQGYITECSRSNLFLVIKDTIYTAPVSEVLPGITRDFVLRACRESGYQVIEKSIHEKELVDLDAIFISGTQHKVLPVRTVKNLDMVLDSAKHTAVTSIMQKYDEIMADDINHFKEQNLE